MDTSVTTVSPEKSPWGWGTIFAVSFLAGFAAGGIIAGINWHRMGKHSLMWPTIIGSIVAFILFVFFLPETVSNSAANFISLAPAWGFWWWQKGYYRTWKESHPEVQRAGWQIPLGTVLGTLVVVSAIIFAPILMPDEATKQFNQAVELQEEGKFQQAVAAYDEAIRLNPEFADAYHNRAICHALLHNYSNAIKDANSAIEPAPRDALTHMVRGAIYAELGQTQKAIADLEKALDLGLESEKRAAVEDFLEQLKASD